MKENVPMLLRTGNEDDRLASFPFEEMYMYSPVLLSAGNAFPKSTRLGLFVICKYVPIDSNFSNEPAF